MLIVLRLICALLLLHALKKFVERIVHVVLIHHVWCYPCKFEAGRRGITNKPWNLVLILLKPTYLYVHDDWCIILTCIGNRNIGPSKLYEFVPLLQLYLTIFMKKKCLKITPPPLLILWIGGYNWEELSLRRPLILSPDSNLNLVTMWV